MLTGTLYGRWPHTGIWACLLSRASREGLIDETPQALAAAIGVPVETLTTCIRDFMNPDPDSRSPEHDGRRLALIHEHRSWGWRVINHAKYKEKARKRVYDENRTASGDDAERKRNDRAARTHVPTSPDESREVPLSSPSPAHHQKQGAGALVLHSSLPQDAWEDWLAHRKDKRYPNDDRTLKRQLALLARYATDVQRDIIDTSIQAGWQGLFPPKSAPRGTQPHGRPSSITDDWLELRHRAEKIGFREPRENETPQAFHTLLTRAEHEARYVGRSSGGPRQVAS